MLASDMDCKDLDEIYPSKRLYGPAEEDTVSRRDVVDMIDRRVLKGLIWNESTRSQGQIREP